IATKQEAYRIRRHIQHIARCLYKAANIEVKLETCKQIEEAINKRCKNFTDDPKRMINSILNRHQEAIVIDRLLFKTDDNCLELTTDPHIIRNQVRKHFQTCAVPG